MDISYQVKILLWIAPSILQVCIAVVMYRRALVLPFSVFFTYSLYVPGRDLMLLLLRDRPNLYSGVYWFGDGIGILLQLMVIYQVFWYLIRPYAPLRWLGAGILVMAALSSIFCAFVLFTLTRAEKSMIELILLLERSARFVEVAVIITAMGFIWHLGLTWKHHACGILLGSGIAGLQLLPVELRGSLHLISNATFMWLKPGIFNCAVIAWAIYFLPQRRQGTGLETLPNTDLTTWDVALRGFLHKR